MKPLATILALSIIGLSAIVSCNPQGNQEDKRGGTITGSAKQTPKTYSNPQERMSIFDYIADHANLTAESLSQMPY